MTTPTADKPALGILCMIAGTMLLTCQDAVAKWLLGEINTGEIMAWRALLSFPFVLLIFKFEGHGRAAIRSRAPRENARRAIYAFFASVLVILSFRVLPLADALAIIFVSPLITTAMSALFLGEPVGWRRWTATCAGFAGVLLIVGPNFDTVGLWALVPLGAAVFCALRDVSTRRLGPVESGPTILFWTMILAAIGGFASMPLMGASMPSPTVWGLLLAAAAMLTLSYRLNIASFKLASGAIVAPLRYLSVVWAGFIGYAVWGDVPNAQKLLGAAVVVGAGLYVWRRETRLEQRME